jgi:uncharacterized protein YjbI with pentapeptide repeats
LSGANLNEADLSEADLTDALLDVEHGLLIQLLGAHSLKGTTMPNGQKYEDWLKSKGRGDDGKDSGPS